LWKIHDSKVHYFSYFLPKELFEKQRKLLFFLEQKLTKFQNSFENISDELKKSLIVQIKDSLNLSNKKLFAFKSE